MKKKVYCKDCKFHKFDIKPDGDFEYAGIKEDYCTEPHKIYKETPIKKVDSSMNCIVRNFNNKCKYWKAK